MRKMFYKVLAWLHEEKGQDLIEYAMITAVLSLGIIAIIVAAGIPDEFTAWGTKVVNAIQGTVA